MTYTFETLSSNDFEQLVGDLLSVDSGVRFRPFPPGPDQGIDLLRGDSPNSGEVVQCKHYRRSGFAKLLRDLKANEKPRIERLSPKHYRLATSLSLTDQNKKTIQTALDPFLSSTEDILSSEDLNQLLRNHPEVEKSHFKLWLTSAAVLERILRNGAAVWDHLEREEIQRLLSVYVEIDAFDEAAKTLSELGYCILSGVPGAGKTTVARILISHLMEHGFTPVFARDDISEALDLLDLNKQQVVFYDDFLGRSSIVERLGKNEDNAITQLLRRASRSKQLKVIFTTREYILRDAQRSYERLNDGELDLGKCIVDVATYTTPKRARILYNHLYFSDLPREYLSAVVADQGYRRIIQHKNFSPRLIEWMTSTAGATAVPADEYLNECLRVLDRPAKLWEAAFNSYLDDASRWLLFVLASFPGPIAIDILEEAWRTLMTSVTSSAVGDRPNFVYTRCLKQLDGSFIQSMRSQSTTAILFHNPSIADFLRQQLARDDDVQSALLDAAIYFDQTQTLLRLSASGELRAIPSSKSLRSPGAHEAIQRTITSSPARLIRAQSRAGDDALHAWEESVGGRLTMLLRWFGKCWPAEIGFVISLLQRVAADDPNMLGFGEDSLDLIPLLRRYAHGKPGVDVLQRKLAEGLSSLMNDTSDEQAWVKWGDIVTAERQLFDDADHAEWQERAAEFGRRELGSSYYPTPSSSDLEQLIEWAESLECAWSIDLEYEKEEVDERRRELEQAEDRRAEMMDDDVFRVPSDTSSDAADIDRMFGSLLDE